MQPNLKNRKTMFPMFFDTIHSFDKNLSRHFAALLGAFTLILLTVFAFFLVDPLTRYLIVNPGTVPDSSTKTSAPYYGVSLDMSQILPTSKSYVKNSRGEDLIDVAKKLGVTLVRITNAEKSFDENQDSLYSKEQWKSVLDKLQLKKIKAVILIETASSNPNYYTPNINSLYLDTVNQYIASTAFSHPAVYAVDIKNEPILTDANIHMLEIAAKTIRKTYPHLLLTVGWWGIDTHKKDLANQPIYKWDDFAAGQKLNSIVDYYSIHMYGLETKILGMYLNPDLRTKSFIASVKSGLLTTKPILIEEFGEANGDAVSDQDTIGSPQLQASVYTGVYQALHELGDNQIIGTVAYQMYSRTSYPDAWSLVKDRGNTLLPAARVLQSFANGRKIQNLQLNTQVSGNEYILTSADNNNMHIQNVADRLGLKLKLDKKIPYTLSFSNPSLFGQKEAFHFDTDSGYFTAVFRALKKGNTKLVLQSTNSCKPKTTCKLAHTQVFLTTIMIQ